MKRKFYALIEIDDADDIDKFDVASYLSGELHIPQSDSDTYNVVDVTVYSRLDSLIKDRAEGNGPFRRK